jgi:hypothetical protein
MNMTTTETIILKEIAYELGCCYLTVYRNQAKWGLINAIHGKPSAKPRLFVKRMVIEELKTRGIVTRFKKS